MTPETQPDGQFVPPGRHPPTAVATATPEPPPPPRVELGWKQPRGIGARFRDAVLRVLDVADKVAEAITGGKR
ncbi:MAG: hypothetical protein IPJ11_07390 [Gemmatimonadetes bacterium]|nr:hypothetical protein [Gemmatimonadota bacterium]